MVECTQQLFGRTKINTFVSCKKLLQQLFVPVINNNCNCKMNCFNDCVPASNISRLYYKVKYRNHHKNLYTRKKFKGNR